MDYKPGNVYTDKDGDIYIAKKHQLTLTRYQFVTLYKNAELTRNIINVSSATEFFEMYNCVQINNCDILMAMLGVENDS